MLTDIFAARYADVEIWKQFTLKEARLLSQAFRIVKEQIFPYYDSGGNVLAEGRARWQMLNDRIATELGLPNLSNLYLSYPSTIGGQPYAQTSTWPMIDVCQNWILEPYKGLEPADGFIKERLSLIELALRTKGEQIASANRDLKGKMLAADLRVNRKTSGLRVPGKLSDGLKAQNDSMNSAFRSAVDELNTRFRQASAPLNYHNGFIQISQDAVITDEVETPFWNILTSNKWANVDLDMKQAIDIRDSMGKDPAFYAAKALESAIKIISSEKGWTSGKEKGAHNFIDNLASKSNGSFIAQWESVALKQFFTDVRNPLSHGAGDKAVPALTSQQTDWALRSCMIWISSLVQRLQ